MRRGLVRVGVSLAAAVLLVFGVACDEETTAEKQATACEELAELDAAVKTLEDVSLTSTVDQLKDAKDDVKEQADDARRAVREYNESKAEDLKQSVEDLHQAVKDISGGQNLAEARASIQDELVAARVAWEKLRADLRCP
jgi:hypothetical protein